MFVQSPSLWLIPFSQLKTAARSAWRQRFGDAVMPQIMTLREWAGNNGTTPKSSDDLHFDPAIDYLTAQRLMHSVAKSTGHRTDPALVQRLLDAAYQLAAVASAIAPMDRPAWIRSHADLFYTPVFQYEAVIKFLALSWAGGSRYDSDVLWQKRDQLLGSAKHIYVTHGLQTDALQTTLLTGFEDKTSVMELGQGVATDEPSHTENVAREIVAADAEDLVQQTLQCLLSAQQVNPDAVLQSIALVALDRQITRRISAALYGRGIAVRDETGWALSTTNAAAQLLAWLNAMARDASSDDVLAALKTAPLAFTSKEIENLEVQIRNKGWVTFPSQGQIPKQIQTWQAEWAAARTVVAWLEQTRVVLQSTHLLTAFESDEAGQAVLAALHIGSESALAQLAAKGGADSQNTKIPLQGFVHWVRSVLEASRFRPTASADLVAASSISVTILPLPQLWGRTFDAIIVPGCDAVRLPARPDLAGDWRASEGEALNLPSMDAAQAAHQKAWDWLCAQPRVTMLRHTSEGSENLQQSLLLQRMQIQGRLLSSESTQSEKTCDQDLRIGAIDVFSKGVTIDWQALAPAKLSASSYADLRACPYRFYATRILELTANDELDGTVDKRDFGTWLHGTLRRFHADLQHDPTDSASERSQRLDRAASAEQAALGLDAAAFLPFSLIWPQAREAYLAWLADHEALGYRFVDGEVWKSFELELAGKSITLVGQIDRIDTTQNGGLLLMDYKTESTSKTKQRISQADEDTQLAFYAALIHNDASQSEGSQDRPVQAAYVNLAERLKDVKTNKDGLSEQMKPLPDLEIRRDALLDGIWSDLSSMADGHGLRALGEGAACTHCQARGLCRKDFQ